MEFAKDMTLQSLVTYFTVEIFVNLILQAIEQPDQTAQAVG